MITIVMLLDQLRVDNMAAILCFRYDQWELVDIEQLEEGDLVNRAGELYEVAAPGYYQEGTPHLPARPYDHGPIKLAIGESSDGIPIDHAIMAMDFSGSTLREFPDGTA
ncbi:hypothetical protein ACGTN6_21050, partial [Halomonas sp. THAF12]|uniref:hypothetical protein n=1 Tax=Halomonas sp. B23F22_10 TaxID=3459515 RepID=UPI00373E400A